MLSLESILRGSSADISKLVDTKKIRIVRHVMSNHKNGDWTGFDDMLKFNRDLLLASTGEQSQNKFRALS